MILPELWKYITVIVVQYASYLLLIQQCSDTAGLQLIADHWWLGLLLTKITDDNRYNNG